MDSEKSYNTFEVVFFCLTLSVLLKKELFVLTIHVFHNLKFNILRPGGGACTGRFIYCAKPKNRLLK
jgi:hypothetical protein